MHSGFGILLVIALEHSVWGFCCTNPCEQLSGEIPTHLVPQLGLGDERLLHTILLSTYFHLALQKIAGSYCSCVSSRGAPSSREGFDPAYQESLWPFQHLGFICRGTTIILRVFLESYHHQIFSFRLGCLGGKGGVL
jgi:hypothetical protein